MEKKELWVSYLLALAAIFGPAGLHRFYLGRPVTGVIYLLTWGLLGFGTIFDLIKMEDMVRSENLKLLEGVHLRHALPPIKPESDEQKILKVAKQNAGRVTVAVIAVETGLELDKAKKQLDVLREKGYCELDLSEEGAELYTFKGFGSTRPFQA